MFPTAASPLPHRSLLRGGIGEVFRSEREHVFVPPLYSSANCLADALLRMSLVNGLRDLFAPE